MEPRVDLTAGDVLAEAWRVYKRLFARSLGIGAIVFGIVRFFDVVEGGGGLVLFSLVLGFAGLALVQGGLVEIVRGLHENGDHDPSLGEVLGRAAQRLGRLVAVSLLAGIGIALGFVLLVVPGLLLATFWAVAVPIAVLEDVPAVEALRRSRELVRGNGWAVFRVVLASGAISAVVGLVFALAASGLGFGPFGTWLMLTLGSALTTPYTAHALTVAYYRLREPDRPVVLAPGQRRPAAAEA